LGALETFLLRESRALATFRARGRDPRCFPDLLALFAIFLPVLILIYHASQVMRNISPGNHRNDWVFGRPAIGENGAITYKMSDYSL
jgi:hypothetical protein